MPPSMNIEALDIPAEPIPVKTATAVGMFLNNNNNGNRIETTLGSSPRKVVALNQLRLSKIVRANMAKASDTNYANADAEDTEESRMRSVTDVEYDFGESDSNGDETDSDNEKLSTLGPSSQCVGHSPAADTIKRSPPTKGEGALEKLSVRTSRRSGSTHMTGSDRKRQTSRTASGSIIPQTPSLTSTVQAVDRSFEASSNHTTSIVSIQNVNFPLGQLLQTNFDVQVRPIVKNMTIEKIMEPKFDATLLPFESKPTDIIERMMSNDKSSLEKYLVTLLKSLSPTSSLSIQGKVSLANYLETIVNDRTASVMINGGVANSLLEIAKQTVSPTLKCQLLSVLGIFCRYATFISLDFCNQTTFDTILKLLQDKNIKIKRRVSAFLGELMYYAATQDSDERFELSSGLISTIAKLLRQGEDEVVQHYISKTFENVSEHMEDICDKQTSA